MNQRLTVIEGKDPIRLATFEVLDMRSSELPRRLRLVTRFESRSPIQVSDVEFARLYIPSIEEVPA